MTNEKLSQMAVAALKKEYPEAPCSLNYTDPLQLLISTRLAAQCTDARVNTVTPALFKKFKNVYDFANAISEDIEPIIKSCGFYHAKARDIVNMCKVLIEKFDGIIPDSVEELIKLPGVGRKTANLIVGDIFKKPAVVVDTHCMRITRRLGFHNLKNPEKIEYVLRQYLPPSESNNFCHRLVIHGRSVCKAINPRCHICCMNTFCNFAQHNKNK